LRRLRQLAETLPVQDQSSSRDQARSRQEDRLVETFAIADALAGSDWHGCLATIVRVTRDRLVFDTRSGQWRESSEIAYYAATTDRLSAAQASHAIRQHWGIENRNHYVRDVSLGEDNSRIRHNPGVMARIKSFALNILRANHTKNVAQATWENALRFDNMLKLKGI